MFNPFDENAKRISLVTSKGLKRIMVPPPVAAATAGITSTAKAIAAAKADFIANMRRE